MMLELLVGAFGFSVLAAVYLALAPGDRGPDDCAGCALREDPGLCGSCGLPETPPPGEARPPDPGPSPWTPAEDDGGPWSTGAARRRGPAPSLPWNRSGEGTR